MSVRLNRQEDVAVLTIARAAKRNALNDATIRELAGLHRSRAAKVSH